MQKKGLGKGLSALIPDVNKPSGSSSNLVEVDQITSNPRQPRRVFNEDQINELSLSIKEKGVIQPLLVRRSGNGYELIAGERRLRASIKAGIRQVPVTIIEASDTETLQLALIENLQREDLNPIDEYLAYKRLQEEFRLSQEEIATKVGKSRPAVANALRLALLPPEVQREVAAGKLPAGQARAILSLERAPLIIAAAREIMAKGLSTREAERLVRRLKLPGGRRTPARETDPNLESLIEGVQRWLGTKVRLLHRARSGKGKIEIEYYSTEDFDRIIRKLTDTQLVSADDHGASPRRSPEAPKPSY